MFFVMLVFIERARETGVEERWRMRLRLSFSVATFSDDAWNSIGSECASWEMFCHLNAISVSQ